MMKMPLLLSGNMLWKIIFLFWPLSLSNHMLCHIHHHLQLLKTSMWLLMANDSTNAGIVVVVVEPTIVVEELQLGTQKFNLLSNFLCLQR